MYLIWKEINNFFVFRFKGDLMRMEKNDKQKSSLSNSLLSEGESGTDIYCIVPKSGSEQPTGTGVYVITWKR